MNSSLRSEEASQSYDPNCVRCRMMRPGNWAHHSTHGDRADVTVLEDGTLRIVGR